MGGIVMKCKELMVGDLVNNLYGVQMRVVKVYDGYAYAAPVNSRRTTWRFDDECEHPVPTPLTCEILKKNGWYWGLTSNEEDIESCVGVSYGKHWVYDEGAGEISLIFPDDTNGGLLKIDDQRFNRHLEFIWNDALYVHELQRALRLCGLDELADNFKI